MNEGKHLSHEHLETVVAATEEFDRDLKGAGRIENLHSYQ